MKLKKYAMSAALGAAFLLTFGAISETSAQGRGNGGGRPAGNPGGGRPEGAGRPTTAPGVDRGLGTADRRSGGRSTQGRDTASEMSGGRSDAGLERARLMRENSLRAEREMQRNPQIGENLRMNANELRASYQTALLTNPELKFGQFVAANMIARNLSGRYPNITSRAILDGLADGDSIGETLRNLGLSRDEAKRAEKEAKRQMENSRRQ